MEASHGSVVCKSITLSNSNIGDLNSANIVQASNCLNNFVRSSSEKHRKSGNWQEVRTVSQTDLDICTMCSSIHSADRLRNYTAHDVYVQMETSQQAQGQQRGASKDEDGSTTGAVGSASGPGSTFKGSISGGPHMNMIGGNGG